MANVRNEGRWVCITLVVTCRCLCDRRGQNASQCKVHGWVKSSSRIKFHCPPFASSLCNGFRTLQFKTTLLLDSYVWSLIIPSTLRTCSCYSAWAHPLGCSLLRHLSSAAYAHSADQGLKKWGFREAVDYIIILLLCSPLASSKEVILWLGENPCRAPINEALPPERAPRGSAPVGVRPFSCRTCSDSSLR